MTVLLSLLLAASSGDAQLCRLVGPSNTTFDFNFGRESNDSVIAFRAGKLSDDNWPFSADKVRLEKGAVGGFQDFLDPVTGIELSIRHEKEGGANIRIARVRDGFTLPLLVGSCALVFDESGSSADASGFKPISKDNILASRVKATFDCTARSARGWLSQFSIHEVAAETRFEIDPRDHRIWKTKPVVSKFVPGAPPIMRTGTVSMKQFFALRDSDGRSPFWWVWGNDNTKESSAIVEFYNFRNGEDKAEVLPAICAAFVADGAALK